MNIETIKNTLNQKFRDLNEVAPNVFRATEKYHDKPYAIRYFDLSDNVLSYSNGLNEYLEKVLGEDYFDVERPIDLRWNNYLYFITSSQQQDKAFQHIKSIIEADREYARKFVITEKELPKYLQLYSRVKKQPSASIQDIYSTWLKLLNEQQLGYILDFNLKIPAIVRNIGTGVLGILEQSTLVDELNVAEKDAIRHPIKNLVKTGFRKYPKENEFNFGNRINLITGPNGHGKTSLLEIIEYLYCGSTYRNGAPRMKTNITATLYNSQETLDTRSVKKFSKRLKARNLGWYGKNDVRGSSLDKSFARFNFMDTDAAIRLSMETTAEQLSDDISRIVLGAEAGKASDQIQRIIIELEKQRNINFKDINQLRDKVQFLEKEKDSLNTMTKQSDTLLQQLNQHLKTIFWINRPNNFDGKSIFTLSENLKNANHQCKLLEGGNLDDLKKQHQELELNNLSLNAFVETKSNFEIDLKSLSKKKEQIVQKINIIEELQIYSGADLLSLEQNQKEQTVLLNTLRAKLPDFQRIELIDDELAKLPLVNALSDTDEKLFRISSDKANTLNKLENYEHSQSLLKNLHDQLISTATKILDSTPDKNHCPLCHTSFEEGQLLLSIASDTMDKLTPKTTDLRNDLFNLQTLEVDLQQIKFNLNALISYCDNASNVTVALAMENIEEDKQKSIEYQKSLRAISKKLEKYSERGLKPNRLRELIGLLDTTENITNELDVSLQSLHTESQKLTNEIISIKSELDGTNRKISALAELTGINEALPVINLKKVINEKIRSCELRIAAAMELANYINLQKGFSTTELSHHINDARDIVSKLITTLKQEEEKNNRIQQIEQQVKNNQGELTDKESTLKYLSKAFDSLSNLLSGENSLESIKHELLKNNAAMISEIFSKIHLPNEYDINVEGEEIKLIHKISKESCSLNEVSTGQRTAFALSLFLTMNKTLGNGPRVLLLDDPISHIDDVNMLSFLDYLRELAIDGERQIFFATPNAKLAGLFRHKFGFLDDNEFKEFKMKR